MVMMVMGRSGRLLGAGVLGVQCSTLENVQGVRSTAPPRIVDESQNDCKVCCNINASNC